MTRLEVSLGKGSGRPFNRRLLGVNHRYFGEGCATWDSARGVPEERVVEVLRDGGFGMLRFPGGTISTPYDWRRAVGPPAGRRSAIGGFGGVAYRNDFGPHEFMTLCEQAGAEPIFVVSPYDARLAASFVAYMNLEPGVPSPVDGVHWGSLRAENGHPEPYGIKFWEVGNELWLAHEISWTLQDPRRYVRGGSGWIPDHPLVKDEDWTPEVGVSDGTPNQSFRLKFPPVVPGSLTLLVYIQPWTIVESLDGAGPERVVQVDYQSGEVLFGDGRNGLIPPRGARLTAAYDSGPHDGLLDFYRLMKAVDPSIQVGTCVNTLEFFKAAGPEYPFDYVILHEYVRVIPEDTMEGLRQRVLAAPAEMRRSIRDTRNRMRMAAGREWPILTTEWNLNMHGRAESGHGFVSLEPEPGFFTSADHGLYVATGIQVFAEEGIEAALIHCLTGVGPNRDPAVQRPNDLPYGILDNRPAFTRRSAAQAMALMGQVLAGELQELDLGGPVMATVDEQGRVGAVVRNQAAAESLEVTLRLPPGDWRVASASALKGTPLGSDASAAARTARFEEAPAEVEIEGSAASAVVPPRSLLGLRLERR